MKPLNSSKYLFSIIIPTYNRGHLITETIGSILAQSFFDFEVIIVDDGSTDNTEVIINAMCAKNERIKYFKKQNGERGAARNYGMQKANGQYAVIFDSDDWMLPNHLEIINNFIQKNKEVNFIATKYNFKNEQGKIEQGGSYWLKEGNYGIEEILKGNPFGCLYTIKLDNPNLTYFPEERMYATLEDWLFLFKNLVDDNITLINKLTITVRQHSGRSMTNHKKVIEVRRIATQWIIKNIKLSKNNLKTLIAYSHYFCGIHQYLNYNRKEAIKEVWKATKLRGINKEFLMLTLKAIIGKEMISLFR